MAFYLYKNKNFHDKILKQEKEKIDAKKTIKLRKEITKQHLKDRLMKPNSLPREIIDEYIESSNKSDNNETKLSNISTIDPKNLNVKLDRDQSYGYIHAENST